MSATTANKRKIEENSDDEDMQLFLKAESEIIKKLKSTEEKVETKTPQTSKEVKSSVSTPKSSIQTKLPFKTLQPSSASKTPTTSKSDTKFETHHEIVKRADGEWFIEDFLLDKQWRTLLQEEFKKKYFIDINNVIREGFKKNILRPPKELVFNAMNSTRLDNIKVVIIGQDPYHDDNQAHGLAFSVPKGIRIPPSLKNIIKELQTDIPGFVHDEKLGGCLQTWTERGVFLLNTFLTVEAHKAGSHSKIGWDIFTDKVIKVISEKNNGCVFLLWGAFAQKKSSLIDAKKHKIIQCAHPSPFSATKFFNSKCFSRANEYLNSIGKTPVNWSLKE